MKKIKLKIQTLFLLLIIFLPVNIVLANNNHVYVLDLEYKNNKFIFKSVFKREVVNNRQETVKQGEFRYELISFDNKVLEKGSFDISAPFHVKKFNINSSSGDVTGQKEKSNLITLKIAYHENGKTINIFNKNKKELEVDVSNFANTCGDSICQKYENYFNCSADCKQVKNVAKNLKQGVNVNNNRLIIKIVIIIFFILISIFIIIFGIKYYNKDKLS